MNEGVWLNQTDASSALGISVNHFMSQKVKFKDNMGVGRKKKYFIPLEKMIPMKRKFYEGSAGMSETDPVLDELIASTDFSGEQAEMDIQ